MRILHTADWHMNETLGRVDRGPDILRSLERIAGYLEERQVEVMIVAGDLFCERSRQEQLRDAVGAIKGIFEPFLRRGGTIVAVSGNHDNPIFFETLRDTLDLVAPGLAGPRGTDATGRLYLAPNPRALRLAGGGGEAVQFVLMPYPTTRFLRGEGVRYSTIEERHRATQSTFVRVLQELDRTGVDRSLPSVLVSHVHVRGAQTHNLYRMSEVDDVVVDTADVPTHWAYVAYGHMHKPQTAFAGASHVRYAGSIERLDLGEAEDEKSVVLCELGPAGLLGEPELLPLDSTPIYRLEITDPATQLPGLAASYPDAQRALVQYTLQYDPATHDRDTLCAAIHEVFPRWYAREVREVGRVESAGAVAAPQQLRDVVGTVRAFLAERLADEPLQEDLLAAAEGLLAEDG